jgi:DNA-binding transcriptional regulator YdaS (Cro superfamily)
MTPEAAKAEITALSKKGIKQSMLAKRLGVSGTLLCFWLSGQRQAPPGKLREVVALGKRMAKALEACR